MRFFDTLKNTVFISFMLLLSCGNATTSKEKKSQEINTTKQDTTITVAANRTKEYLPMLQHKKIAVVANPTSVIFNASLPNGYTHIVDSLLSLNIQLAKVFAPEHGFRGVADAGEHVTDGMDKKTNLPIISLYGKNRKPKAEQLADVDLVLFDIQDVGVRFYTYIATLQLVMEACADAQIPMVILDRPNPNAHYVDGPMMEAEHTSFLGLTPIPLVYGMTIGEYAHLLVGEKWLRTKEKLEYTVIPLSNYTHKKNYGIPVRPSPNLPNDVAINLYPSLGLFEGTTVNAGRGTEFQFQRYGASFLNSAAYSFSYTPKPNFGSKHPKEEGKLCYGNDLATEKHQSAVTMKWIIDAYQNSTDKTSFFTTSGFTKHAGTATLQQDIIAGKTAEEIHESWQPDIAAFKKTRAKYLLYID